MSSTQPDDFSPLMNAHRGGFAELLGIQFVLATPEKVIAELEVGPLHLQPYGVVHGGVYSALIETIASAGAALNSMPRGQSAVGLENNTAFLRAVRGGLLRATATPVSRGRRTQVWLVDVRDAEEQVVATGRVRMLCLEAGAKLGGEEVELKTGPLPSD